jgi:hypothetical protein
MKNYLEIAKQVKENTENWKQFDKKNMWWSDAITLQDGCTYRVLKSYNTIVAVIDVIESKLIEIGKWSSTTSKQVTQYHGKYCKSFDRVLLKQNLSREWC